MQKQIPYFVIEGNIGAGKSTFLHLIQNYLDVQLVFEPHHKWQDVAGENLLDHFYKDMPRWAYTFQSLAFISRVREQEEHARYCTHPAQVMERSVFSDRYCFARNCFEMGIMSELEWHLYCQWFDWLALEHMQRPAGFIYLRTSPEVCYSRLKKRKRKEEAGVSYDYLKLLHEKHEAWLIHREGLTQYLHNIPALTLSCDAEFEYDKEQQEEHMKQLGQFIEQISYTPMVKNTYTSVSAE